LARFSGWNVHNEAVDGTARSGQFAFRGKSPSILLKLDGVAFQSQLALKTPYIAKGGGRPAAQRDSL
jgi:hypothetical protein